MRKIAISISSDSLPNSSRDLQVDFDAAAFREAIHVPAKRGSKTGYVEQRGMQEMRDGADFPADLFDHRSILGDGSGTCGIELIRLTLHDCYVHAESGEQLPDAIVQLPCNLPALFIANLLQAT